jgi:hypothetical protein
MAVSKALGDPDATIRVLRPIRSSKLHRVYEVVLSDGRTLELVMPPPSMLRLLRSERQIINSEALVIQWLTTLLSQGSPANPGSTQDEDKEDATLDRAGRDRGRSSGTSSQLHPAESGPLDDRSGLLRLLPKLVNRTVAPASLGAPYNIYRLRGGTPIANLPRPLTKQERADVDFQLGHLTRQLAEIPSPTGRFGHAVSILPSAKPIPGTKDGSRSPTPSASGTYEGSRTWSAAFNLMFEGVLRDSEDMAIMLAYPIIRKYLVRLGYLLDEVTVSSLVFIDGMEDNNVLVSYEPTVEGSGTKEGQRSSGRDSSDRDEGPSEGDQVRDEAKEKAGAPLDDALRKGVQSAPTAGVGSRIQVVGLRDWSNGIFGDPLLATTFSNNPSKQLLDGFYDTTAGKESPAPSSEGHDASAKKRLLLYQAYHATVSIATEFYRPQSESTTRELAARRKLTEVLTKLEEVEDDPRGSRHRRPSGEMSPAKKLKPDEKERPPSSRRHGTPIQEV